MELEEQLSILESETELDVNGLPEKKYKPRKNILLWQSYLMYLEVLEMRKTHLLRISSIEKKRSSMDKGLEEAFLEIMELDKKKHEFGKQMINYAKGMGEIWDWITSIRGMKAGLLPAQLLAQIDDISLSPTVSSLWRFSGFAVMEGKAEKREKGSRSPYNGLLKGVCFNISEAFIKQQTPIYVDRYYAEKIRQRELNPMELCRVCQIPAVEVKVKRNDKQVRGFRCPDNHKHTIDFTKKHIHFRGMRKMIKLFLKDLWIAWRQAEGLDTSDPWLG